MQYQTKMKIRNKNRQFINPVIVTSAAYRISGSLHIVNKLHSLSKSYTQYYNLVCSKAKGHTVCMHCGSLPGACWPGGRLALAVLTIFGLLVLCYSLTTHPWSCLVPRCVQPANEPQLTGRLGIVEGKTIQDGEGTVQGD